MSTEKKVALFLADGCEEIEALTVVDLLFRAGIPCDTVSINETAAVTSSHNVKITADCVIGDLDFEAYDMLVLPGGMPGTLNLEACSALTKQVKKFYSQGKMIAAICAAPSVLAGLSFLKGRRATSYPGCLDGYEVGEYCREPVVTDGHVITSRGVGTAIPFALTLIEKLEGAGKADQIASSILYSTEYLQGVDYVSGR